MVEFTVLLYYLAVSGQVVAFDAYPFASRMECEVIKEELADRVRKEAPEATLFAACLPADVLKVISKADI